MIDFSEIDYQSDGWELFARDFLEESGFFIDSTVDRGADGGKDLLVVEQLNGMIGRYQLRWLVSCKHLATSRRSVTEADEGSILERVKAFNADGFIGFYSTLASSALNTRLYALRERGSIRDYRIYDHKAIENVLVTVGYSHLMMRYFPLSYQIVKPLHRIGDEYSPLSCEVCNKDLLMESFNSTHSSNVIYAYRYHEGDNTGQLYEGVYVTCKEGCDQILQRRLLKIGMTTSWKDIGDLLIPIEFLRFVFAMTNRIRDGQDRYTDEAYRQELTILSTIAQRVLRHTTEYERQRYGQLLEMWPF